MDAIANQSGHDLAHLPSIERGEIGVLEVPLLPATGATLRGLGRLVEDYASAAVDIVPWPAQGRRPIVPGTGRGGGLVHGSFVMQRHGSLLLAENHAVRRRYVTGWYRDPATAALTDAEPPAARIFTHEANYHPDGGQVFFPRQQTPFVALLAPPGDDVRPDDFRAFYFDGRCGVHIDAGVWHQPVFPLASRAELDDTQGAVHACVSLDFIGEFGLFLAVPLRAC